VVEPADDFDDAHDEGSCGPLLPPDDRLWRHPSELGEHALPVGPEALSARRSWMAASPTRAGAWSAGIVGALLAAGVVLLGGHLTHLLPSSRQRPQVTGNGQAQMDPSRSSFVATSTTVVVGVEPGLYKMAAAVVPAMPMVFVDHKPSGVGVIVSPKGYVLVPDSLITDADDIGVFINGQLLPASLVGVDSGTGLAVVRVHSIEALTSASFVSDTSVGFGSFVAVIWVDGTGTHSCWGTVSDLDVKLSSSDDSPPLLESLETLDPTVGVATGGVIVDGTGHLVGMITGAGNGTLVATPGWLADIVSTDLISYGRVVHGWLGITGETATMSPTATAVKVLSVTKGGAAAKAGVKPGDLIEAVNGESTSTMPDMVAALYSLPPNRSVKIDVDRDGHTWDTKARLTAAA
jgi:S1-C subfamily serine protease